MNGFELLGERIEALADAVSLPILSGVFLGILAMIFGYSGAMKLRDRDRTARAIVDLGLARRQRPGLSLAAGAYEALLAAALVTAVFVEAARPVVAGVAAVTLAVFVMAQIRVLARHEVVACFCFGSESDVVTRGSAARTLGLMALALLAAVAGEPGATAAPSALAQLLMAQALLGTVLLAATWGRLRGWARDPFGLRDELWVRRETA